MPEPIGLVLSVIAVAVSIVVFVDNRVRDLRAARLARQPALVFTWHASALNWSLQNIGSGPALDVVIAQRLHGIRAHALRRPGRAADGQTLLPRLWIEAFGSDPGLGAHYRSITDEEYWTTTADDRSTISIGAGPSTELGEIEPHWSYGSLPSSD